MSFIVTPNAREMFTLRELTEAYTNFEERGPQYVSAESGLSGATYRFGTRVLLVYEESQMGVVVLTPEQEIEEAEKVSTGTQERWNREEQQTRATHRS